MKILTSDVWSIHNAGDAAILEALLDGLRRAFPGAELQVAARFPESCGDLAGVEVVPDVLAFDAEALDAQLAHRRGRDAALDRLRGAYEDADLVVSTGGYFLNATPGNPFTHVLLSRLLHFAWASTAGVPVVALGQSVGPFGSAELRTAARQAFDDFSLFTVRDVQSWSYLQRTGLAPRAQLTADLAVGLKAACDSDVTAAMERLGLPGDSLAISVRSYPGTPPGAFEAMARAADRAVEDHGVDVLLIGTTVPPAALGEGVTAERALGNDDLVALEAVRRHMRHGDRVALCGESLPPRLLKGVLATCRGLVATRMHAAILGSTSGVPTAGIAYEYKVEGWFDQLGLPDLVLPLPAMAGDALPRLMHRVLAEGPALREHLDEVLPEVRGRCERNFQLLAELAPGGEPAEPGVGWRQEALHYDVPHRRLQRILEWLDAPRDSGDGGRHGGRVLDVGCSAGTLGRLLRSRDSGTSYHGCDVSAEAVAEAVAGPDGLEVVEHRLEHGLPEFDGQPYDSVVASGILEYIDDVPTLLGRIRERLAPGGRLVVSYFNMHHVSRRRGRPYRHPLWKNDWSPGEFRELLAAAGFTIERTSWSTAGPDPAPDVRDEARAIELEATITVDETTRDDLCHTLLYECSVGPVAVGVRVEPVAPPVSVVMPCKDRLDLLRPVLEGFLAEAERTRFELVLVDDGSDPPAAGLLEELGDPALVRPLRHPRNRGRGAALDSGLAEARGELVIFCDSDIVPEIGFVAEHQEFHQQNPSELATHLGNLVWGIEPGLFGRLVGARSNPRMKELRGPVGWAQWYTDNWSFKRSLFVNRGLGFDPGFQRWGWEDLELARRLAALGASNTATARARGRHLKLASLDGLRANFARSVPNLVHLARIAPEEPAVADWLLHRFSAPEPLLACEALLEQLWQRCVELDAGVGLAANPATPRLAIALNDAAFATGLARGFLDEYGAKLPEDLELAAPDDRAELLGFASLIALVFLAGANAGQQALSERMLVVQLEQFSEAAQLPALAGPLGQRVEAVLRIELDALAKG